MNVQSFMLVGETLHASVKVGCESALGAWSARWFGSESAESFTISEFFPLSGYRDIDRGEESDCWYCLGGRDIPFYLRVASFQRHSLLTSVLSVYDEKGGQQIIDGPSAAISKTLVDDLITCLLQAPTGLSPEVMAESQWALLDELPLWLRQPGSGAIFLKCRLGATELQWVLHPGFVQKFLRRHDPAALARKVSSRVSETLGMETIRVFVGIDAAEKLPLESLNELDVDDVILLDKKIAEPWDLLGEDGDRLASCYLGRRNGKNTVSMIAPAAPFERDRENKNLSKP